MRVTEGKDEMKIGNITPKASGKMKKLFEKAEPTEDGKERQGLTSAIVDPKVKYISVWNKMYKKHLKKFQDAMDYNEEMSGMECSLPTGAIKEEATAMADVEFAEWVKTVLPFKAKGKDEE